MLPRTEERGLADVPRLVADVSSTADFVEGRLLRLVREAAGGAVSLHDLTVELSILSKDLQKCYRHLAETSDRRDLGFRTMAALEQLGRHYLWLYRKIYLEQAFYTKLDLEAKLRSVISPEGYALYQEILCIEESERGLLEQSDAELRSALLSPS